MAEKQRLQTLSLKEFMGRRETGEIEEVLSKLNGGSFMDCHVAIFEQTGVWIPELVPVFQRLDAALAFRDLPVGVTR